MAIFATVGVMVLFAWVIVLSLQVKMIGKALKKMAEGQERPQG